MTGPYPYPANITKITEALFNRIVAGVAGAPYSVLSDGETVLLEEDVYYGDQSRLPHATAVCLEPSDKDRVLSGAPNMTTNDFTIFILVYVQLVQDVQQTRKDADNLAYDIEHWLHQDLQLSGTLIHGFVSRAESGFTFKQNTLYRSSRMTYSGRNKTSLPVA